MKYQGRVIRFTIMIILSNMVLPDFGRIRFIGILADQMTVIWTALPPSFCNLCLPLFTQQSKIIL